MSSEPSLRATSRWGLLTSATAPVLLIGGWTLAASLQPPGFSQVSDTISALAAHGAADRWVMTSALAGVGLAHLGTALALRPAAPAGRAVLAIGGVATALVAAFPLPSGDGSSAAHTRAATIAFVSLAIWPALSWRRSRREPAGERDQLPLPLRPGTAIAASGLLLAGLGWFFAELLNDGDQVGLSERVAAASQSIWPLAAVLLTLERAAAPPGRSGR